MKNPLAIQMIVRNNESTIESCLDSISSLNAKILVGDIGSTDATIENCRRHGATIVKLSLNNDLSQARNSLLGVSDAEWNLCLEPWEVLLKGQETLKDIPKGAYRPAMIQGDVITRPLRLFHKDTKLKFTNPVFEHLSGDGKNIDLYINSLPAENLDFRLKLVSGWKKRSPLANEPNYYLGCLLLAQKKWKEFINVANDFVFREKSETMSVTMLRYYLAMVFCYVEKDYKQAMGHLLVCLMHRPLMAEFWCLLGDVYYSGGEFGKARSFYENAILLGSQRLREDIWPMEIPKYREYPERMIESCSEVVKASIGFS